jgi:hypothetical protein
MTKDNAQKQAIRARMAKTGERYTTARHYLLDLHRPEHANADVDRSSWARFRHRLIVSWGRRCGPCTGGS